MINIKQAQKFCTDYTKIENYKEAINDKTQTWVCHHKNGIILNKSHIELDKMGLYYNRPANEFIFLTRAEHSKLHNKGKKVTEDKKQYLSNLLSKPYYIDGIKVKGKKNVAEYLNITYSMLDNFKRKHKSGEIYKGHKIEWY